MPTYEYKCDACGAEFERFQPITADPVKRCPECGKAKVRRLISTGGGMIFKGSGFYITDYRDKAYTDKAKSESGAGDKGGDKPSDSKGETGSKPDSKPDVNAKPAAKSDSKPKSDTKSDSKPSSGDSKPKKKR